MSAVIEAIRENQIQRALDLLKDEAVRNNAAARNNEALRKAAAYGHLPVVIELLKIKAVYDAAAVNNNMILSLAATNGHLPVVMELLKIKTVYDNAAGRIGNWYLHIVVNNKQWLIMVELLKLPDIQKNLAIFNHQILKSTLEANELGIADLIIKIYRQQALQLPVELKTDFEKRSEALSKTNKKLDYMISFLDALLNNRHKILSLLQDENYRNIANMGGNMVLHYMAIHGQLAEVKKLLEIQDVTSNVAEKDNRILCHGIRSGHAALVAELLKVQSIYNLAAVNDNQALRLAAQLEQWPIVLELLKVKPIMASIDAQNHVVLRTAIAANKLGIVLRILVTYDEQQISKPDNIVIQLCESFVPVSILSNKLQEVQTQVQESLQHNVSFPPSLATIVFQFANLAPIIEVPIGQAMEPLLLSAELSNR